MRTKRNYVKRLEADPVYGSDKVQKLINRSMRDGKKSVAQKQVYAALDLIKEKSKTNPLDIFETAIQNITPRIEVRSRRVGGAAYQVPMPVSARRGLALALRWLINETNKRSNKEYHSYAEKLAAELMDAASNQGNAIQKKLTSHKMAEANKAFAHFRW